MYAKICEAHTVRVLSDEGHVLLYVDQHFLNEYTSPQAFTALRERGHTVRRPTASFAVVDHVNSTAPGRRVPIADAAKAAQVSTLERNCRDFGIELFGELDKRQGIEHVVAAEQGFVLPGTVVVAGDSHTCTHGALGALAFGIGTSEVEHVLATQTLVYRRMKTLRVTVDGVLAQGLTPKDLVLHLIARIGASGASGFVVEFAGGTIDSMTVEGRMTVCNMAVEAGARGALVAPDERTLEYLKGRPRVPKGALWTEAVQAWRALKSDSHAAFDLEMHLDAGDVSPMVSWGTSPDQAIAVDGRVPDPASESDPLRRAAMHRALRYMDLAPGDRLMDLKIDRAFIGSCTNGRIEDLRSAANVVRGRRVAPGVRAMVVPGSSAVRAQAEAEGLHRVFLDAGFEWRRSGCSMCVAMNDDHLQPGERCASSTNRNFEGRQGAGGRTHLMSPAAVAAAAVTGRIADIRRMEP
jgi:3-isopropylmalate/(R)-2-methylmalate dehydratase large subunit